MGLSCLVTCVLVLFSSYLLPQYSSKYYFLIKSYKSYAVLLSYIQIFKEFVTIIFFILGSLHSKNILPPGLKQSKTNTCFCSVRGNWYIQSGWTTTQHSSNILIAPFPMKYRNIIGSGTTIIHGGWKASARFWQDPLVYY